MFLMKIFLHSPRFIQKWLVKPWFESFWQLFRKLLSFGYSLVFSFYKMRKKRLHVDEVVTVDIFTPIFKFWHFIFQLELFFNQIVFYNLNVGNLFLKIFKLFLEIGFMFFETLYFLLHLDKLWLLTCELQEHDQSYTKQNRSYHYRWFLHKFSHIYHNFGHIFLFQNVLFHRNLIFFCLYFFFFKLKWG